MENIFPFTLIVFLLVFKSLTSIEKWVNQKFSYAFALIGIAVSALSGLLTNEPVSAILCGVSAFCHAAALFFLFDIKEKWILAIGALAFGGFSFLLPIAATYILVLTSVITFSITLWNLVTIDKLTGLHNRYGMELELRKQLRQYKRKHSDSFYIISCDLDKFKMINDTWGHHEGDRALTLISDMLKRVCHEFNSDVFRIGGDEFVIITDTSEEGLAQEITQAVENALDEIVFRDDFTIEMSLGSALYDGVSSVSDLLKKADKHLYEAKRR